MKNCEVCGQAVELSDGTTKFYIPKEAEKALEKAADLVERWVPNDDVIGSLDILAKEIRNLTK